MQSNINSYYEKFVWSLVERVRLIRKDCENNEIEFDEDSAINEAIDAGFIYGTDEAYVVAHAMMEGVVSWGDEVNWDELIAMLINDVTEEYEDNEE